MYDTIDQLWKIVKISTIIWVFEGVWVICAKATFLHSLDVQIKMFTNSLTVLNQQTLGRTDHVHCFLLLKKTHYDPFFRDGVQLPQGYTAISRRKLNFYQQSPWISWYLFDWSWNDGRLSRPWNHTQSTKSWLVAWFRVVKRPVCCFF